MTPPTELTLFTTTTLFGCILSLVSIPWQIDSMNISSVLLSSWLLVGCFTLSANSLVMNATIWCDISTKLMVGAYIGVPASMVCVLHRLYMTVSAPDSLPDKRFYQLLCRLGLMLGMPALIIVVHIIVQDRRYIFIEQAGCIPSISPSLFPLVGVLIWPLPFNVASLAYLGLFIHLIWAPRHKQGETRKSSEVVTPHHLLRPSTSLFLGIICTSSFSLFLLLSIVNNSNISVNSLHHDFQTVYIITTDQWSRNPQFRAAVELRWLWASLGFVLTIGLFPKERADRLLERLAATKLYIRARTWHRPTSNTVCHGSLPVYVSRTSSSSYGERPTIPPLARQSTLVPAFISRVSPVSYQQPKALSHVPEPDTRSKLSQSCESIRPSELSEPSELPQSSRFSQQSGPVPDPAASMLTLAESISPVPSVGGASSYQTCEESTRC